jgi:hypothetical protein
VGFFLAAKNNKILFSAAKKPTKNLKIFSVAKNVAEIKTFLLKIAYF